MLQLHPNFNIEALKAFVTSKVVEQAVTEVQVKVAATQGAAQEAAATSGGGSCVEIKVPVKAPKVVEVEEEDFFFF